ncbi:MAG: aminotransferase class I/II-fold pyridoxal phosphate-dependent enzyme [Solirubrobacteraceae bacterium]|nr:aminotransferase class I/II-fold pyridoxal phosphate-dependent enzyme [Solirubrobacteraceae bacterium]
MSPATPPARLAPPLNPLLTGPREYPFVTLDRRRDELAPAGVPIINFGIGDPRERTPEFIVEALREGVPPMSSYPAAPGRADLRAACAGWLERRFGVKVDPERHVLSANGTKEAVFLLAMALVGRGSARDVVVIPSPAYPVYEPAARFAGAEPHVVPLRSEDGWKFRIDRVPEEVWARTALLWLNTPHNPTGATLEAAEMARVAAFARERGFWVASDEAYSEIWFSEPPPTMLQQGLDNVLVLHTLSKRSAMTGFRSGFMCGDERLIAALRRFRPNVGVATPDFVQSAAVAAWKDDAHPEEQRSRYAVKRRILLDYFERRGWRVEASTASFYLWMRVPGGDDPAFVDGLLRAGLVAMPGSFLGPGGEGFVRWALVPTPEACREACARLEGVQA